MIDLENDIYSYVSNAIKTQNAAVFTASDYLYAPPSLPAVSIVEIGNRVFERMRADNIENAVTVTFECNVFSNKAAGDKREAKAITNVMDEAFERIGFTRTMREQVANFNDATIYRIVCRYEGIIGLPGQDGKYLIYFNNY